MRINLHSEQLVFIKSLDPDLDLWGDYHARRKQIFTHSNSFRLTEFGFKLSKLSSVSFIQINLDRSVSGFTSRHILALNAQDKPYYYASNHLYLQDEVEAAMFLLINGDMDLYANMKKDQQDS